MRYTHHYSSIHDVQTLAMLCCAFTSPNQPNKIMEDHERDLERGVMAIESNMVGRIKPCDIHIIIAAFMMCRH